MSEQNDKEYIMNQNDDEYYISPNKQLSKCKFPEFKTQPNNLKSSQNSYFQQKIDSIKNNANNFVGDNSFENMMKEYYFTRSEIPPLIENMEGMKSYDMKDYYVNLKTVIQDEENDSTNIDNISGEKIKIEVNQIFDEIMNFKSVSKILIVGGAGVGKSTLMQYMTYKWSQGDIWKDKFIMIYRVQLKNLLNQGWKSIYETDKQYSADLEKNPLRYLIHYSIITNSKEKSLKRQIKPEEINLDQKDNTLLLLDGYDEVYHLSDDQLYKTLELEIFQQKFIILTSRQNAVSNIFKQKFQRVIENTGLDQQGIYQYIDQYFQREDQVICNSKKLKELIKTNPSIGSICHIPVNLGMVCYIFKQNEQSLSSIYNSCSLYLLVIQKLAERFLSKDFKGSIQEGQQLQDKIQQKINNLPEIIVIKHLAYISLTGGGIQIDNTQRKETLIVKTYHDKRDKNAASIEDSIESTRAKTNIIKVVKMGLLKQEGVRIKNTSYSYIHLSFQEYLTADFMVEKLINGNSQDKKDILNYISTHRNEPRLLLVLKFMSGIILQQENKRISQDFWNAMCCNVDGVLEFSLENKIKLMINLIGQSTQQKDLQFQLCSMIPNFNDIVNLIDAVVINNINHFIQALKDSNYLSDNMNNLIINLLQGNDNSQQILENINHQYLDSDLNAKETTNVNSQINNENRIQEIIQFILINRQNIKNQNQQNQIQIEQINYNEIPKDYDNSKIHIIFNGLIVATQVLEKIDQQIYEKSISELLNSNISLNIKKSAICLINEQLENMSSDFQKQLFKFMKDIEINYIEQYKNDLSDKNVNGKTKEILNYFYNVLKQNQTYTQDYKGCLFCSFKHLDNFDQLFKRQENNLYETFITSLKYMSKLDINEVLAWINLIFDYFIHIGLDINQQIFSLVQQIQTIYCKKASENNNLQTFQLFMRNLQLSFLSHFEIISDETFYKICDNLQKNEFSIQFQENILQIFNSYTDNHFIEYFSKIYYLISSLNQQNRDKCSKKVLDFISRLIKTRHSTYFGLIDKLYEKSEKNHLSRQQYEKTAQEIFIYFEQLNDNFNQQNTIKDKIQNTILLFFHKYSTFINDDNFNKNQILRLMRCLQNNYKQDIVDNQEDILTSLSKNKEINKCLIEVDKLNQKNIFIFNLLLQFIFELKDTLLKQKIVQLLNSRIEKIHLDENERTQVYFRLFNTVCEEQIEFLFQCQLYQLVDSSCFQDHLLKYGQISTNIKIFRQFLQKYINHLIENEDDINVIVLFFNDFLDLLNDNEEKITLIKSFVFMLNQQLERIQQSLLPKVIIFNRVEYLFSIFGHFFNYCDGDYYQIIQSQILNVLHTLKNISEFQSFDLNILISWQQYIVNFFLDMYDDKQVQQILINTFDRMIELNQNQMHTIKDYSWVFILKMSKSQDTLKIKNLIKDNILNSLDESSLNYVIIIKKKIQVYQNLKDQEFINEISTLLQSKITEKYFQNILEQIEQIFKKNNEDLNIKIREIKSIFDAFLSLSFIQQIKKMQIIITQLLSSDDIFNQSIKEESNINPLLYLVNNQMKIKIIKQIIRNNNIKNINSLIETDFDEIFINILYNEQEKKEFMFDLICNLYDCIDRLEKTDVKIVISGIIKINQKYSLINQNTSKLIIQLLDFLLKQEKNIIQDIILNKMFKIALKQINQEDRIQYIKKVNDILQFKDFKQYLRNYNNDSDNGLKQYFKLQIGDTNKMNLLNQFIDDEIQNKNYYGYQKEFFEVKIFMIIEVVMLKETKNPSQFVNILFNKGDHKTIQQTKQKLLDSIRTYKYKLQFKILVQQFLNKSINDKDFIDQYNHLITKIDNKQKKMTDKNIKEISKKLQGQYFDFDFSFDFVKNINHKFIIFLISIISFENEELSDRRELIKECKTVLKLFVKQLDDKGINWIFKNIQFLSSISYSYNVLVQNIIQLILKDGILIDNSDQKGGINQYQVLIDIINLGANISLNERGTLTIDGQRFNLVINEQRRIELDKELSKVMRTHKNPFINQYTSYKPILQNNSLNFIASVDKQQLSIIGCEWNYKTDSKKMQINSEWKMIELIGYSGDKIIFFEKRDIFGKRMICKIEQQGNNNDIINIFDEDLIKIFGNYNGPQLFYGKIYSNPYKFKQISEQEKLNKMIDWNEIKNDLQFTQCYNQFYEQIKFNQEQNQNQDISNTISETILQEEQITQSNNFEQIPFELYHDALLRMEVTSWRMQDIVFFEFTKTLKDYEQTLLNEINKLYPGNSDIKKQFLGYYRGFVKTFSICYTEAQIIVNGKVDYYKGISGLNAATKVISFMPFIGNITSTTFKSIGEFIIAMKIQKKAKALLNFAYDHSDLSQKCGYLSILIIKKIKSKLFQKSQFGYLDIFMQKHEQKCKKNKSNTSNDNNLNPSFAQQAKTKYQSILKSIKSLKEFVNKNLFGELYKDEYEELGNSDATKLIEIICKQVKQDDSENMLERIKKDLNYQLKNDIKEDKNQIKSLYQHKSACQCQIF